MVVIEASAACPRGTRPPAGGHPATKGRIFTVLVEGSPPGRRRSFASLASLRMTLSSTNMRSVVLGFASHVIPRVADRVAHLGPRRARRVVVRLPYTAKLVLDVVPVAIEMP